MSEYVNFLKLRIKALEDANLELRTENEKLTGYVYDLCQTNVIEDYKRVILHDVFDMNPQTTTL